MRWGILGAAKIARTDLAPAMQLARGADLVALATRDAAKAAPFQALAPALRVHDSYDALLADPEVDAVYIPLPNDMHVDWSIRAAQAGKHVLCEKPIALQADQIDELIATRDATGKLIAEAFMVAHHPQWALVRDLLAQGVIGRLEHIEGCFTYTNRDLGNIRHDPAKGGGGLRDVGVYPCITARMATGAEPTRLRSDIRYQNGVDTFARVWVDFLEFTMSFYLRHDAAAPPTHDLSRTRRLDRAVSPVQRRGLRRLPRRMADRRPPAHGTLQQCQSIRPDAGKFRRNRPHRRILCLPVGDVARQSGHDRTRSLPPRSPERHSFQPPLATRPAQH